MRYPACISASLFALGILLGDLIRAPLAPLFAVAFTVLALSILLGRWRHLFLYPLVFVTGWTGIAQFNAVLDPCDIRLVTPSTSSLVTLEGTLTSSPSDRVIFRQG
ncbi:MAG: ComEC/Rec2-related protein, partial [Verrucomicrobiales bacterium]|nr:ComEC/Rec2-related protein [Verrucomicrobiales bacterium]